MISKQSGIYQITWVQSMANMQKFKPQQILDHSSTTLNLFSLVLLAIVSGDYRLVNADIGGYGSNSDSGYLNSTNFFKQLNSRNLNIPPSAMLPNDPNGVAVPHFFIGDEAFLLCRDYGHSKKSIVK